jgi:hypothetical protein
MPRTLFLGALTLCACVALSFSSFAQTPIAPETKPQPTSTAQDSQKKEVQVWVNTKSGLYYCPNSRWYGTTKQGKYMSECAALKAGYKSAYYLHCGSDCK